MKKIKWILLCLAFAFVAILCINVNVYAAEGEEEGGEGEPEVTEPTPEEEIEVFECTVNITKSNYGTITTDKVEGNVGEIVTVTVKHDLFYKIGAVSVNGTALIEDENIAGLYTFALVEGENVIAVEFVVDQELLGDFAITYQQIQDKDWTNLFSVENIFRIITSVFSGGMLLAMVRYWIKDKKLADKIEKAVQAKVEELMGQAIPNSTKDSVLEGMKNGIVPYFSEMFGKVSVKMEEIGNALTVFSRCFALSLENTPESRIAITKELSSLALSDQEAVSDMARKLEEYKEIQKQQSLALLQKLEEIEKKNTEILAQNAELVEEKAQKEAEKEAEKEVQNVTIEVEAPKQEEEKKEEVVTYSYKEDGTQI